MKDSITVTGMVLLATPVGDYDKRLVILTKEKGKVTAFARGARRPSSMHLAAANPFAFGEFELYPGKDAYTLQRANISEYFRDLATDYDMACYGFYFTEVANYYGMENADDRELLKLVYQSLKALSCGKFSFEFVQRVFEMKVMGINGEYPDVFSCVSCKKKENLKLINLNRGGCVCEDCTSKVTGMEVSEGVLYAMQFILTSSIQKLYTFTLTAEALEEFAKLIEAMKRLYMPHPFKSLDMIIKL